jgi:Ni/Fe-hydrogenase subunit HybB-like protein
MRRAGRSAAWRADPDEAVPRPDGAVPDRRGPDPVRLVDRARRITAMNDGYPWGLWIAFDVVTGTALACGGYAVALLVYVLNKGKYHPLVRPAVLTSALGYTLAGAGVGLDVGRWWSVWRVPLFFWRWNLNSVLLEVALCIMSYMFVLGSSCRRRSSSARSRARFRH